MKSNAIIAAVIAATVCGRCWCAVEDSPTLTVEAPQRGATSGTPFAIRYRVSWTGSPDAYAVAPITLGSLSWADIVSNVTTSDVANGENEVVQTFTLRPNEVGRQDIPAVKVALIKGATGSGDFPATQTLAAEALSVDVHKRKDWLIAAIAAVVGCVIALASAVLLMRRKRRRPATPGVSPWEQVQALLHEARRKRLDGNFYDFYRVLGEASEPIKSPAAHTLGAAMERKAQDAGYRGVRPSDDEMDADLRDLERALKQWMEESPE